jgi:L-lactate dehydrogenase complex protein LldG
VTDARSQILGLVRRSLGGTGDPQAVDAHLAGHPRNLVPKRAQLPRAELVKLFETMALEAACTVDRVASLADVPDAVARYLAAQNLPAAVRVAPDPALDPVPWETRPTLQVERGRADPADVVSVTGAFAAVAETGTLMMLSGPAHPTTLNFLPETQIAVVRAERVVGPYEDAWDMVRRERGQLPRTVNFITGPSRTADIEMTLYMGAHGPRRLHVVLVDETPA